MKIPKGFTDFVSEQGMNPSYAISTITLGNGSCEVTPEEIDCSQAFDDLRVTKYDWNAGKITYAIVEKSQFFGWKY